MIALRMPATVAAGAAVVTLAASLVSAAPPRHASYTVAQAERGRLAYIHDCAECHGGELEGQFGPALAGPNDTIQYDSAEGVYAYITAQMPNGNAGGLPPSEYLDIMAFLYERSGIAAGARPLTAASILRDKLALGK